MINRLKMAFWILMGYGVVVYNKSTRAIVCFIHPTKGLCRTNYTYKYENDEFPLETKNGIAYYRGEDEDE